MIGPDNGTPENILRFLNTMGVLNVQFEDLMATTTQATQDGGEAPTGNTNNTSQGTTIDTWFDDLFDNTKPKYYGYNFHSVGDGITMPPSSQYTDGHLWQPWQIYENHTAKLQKQYFKNGIPWRFK